MELKEDNDPHEGFENEIAKSFIGFISKVCIFAASYEVKAKVLKGKTRKGIQPPNTEYLFFYPEIKPRDVLSQVRSCFTVSF